MKYWIGSCAEGNNVEYQEWVQWFLKVKEGQTTGMLLHWIVKCALSDIVYTISSISIDALVSLNVFSYISDSQRRQTQLLTDGQSTMSAICDTYQTCLCVLGLSLIIIIFLPW